MPGTLKHRHLYAPRWDVECQKVLILPRANVLNQPYLRARTNLLYAQNGAFIYKFVRTVRVPMPYSSHIRTKLDAGLGFWDATSSVHVSFLMTSAAVRYLC